MGVVESEGSEMTPKYRCEFFVDARKEWRWRLIARNGQFVAGCGEGYHNLADCRTIFRNIKSAMRWGRVTTHVQER